ncbi:hypothetical protein [Halocola ammonii]
MGKKRRIIIVGLPLFAKRLAEALKPRMESWNVIHLDTYTSRKDQLKGLFLIPKADVIYSINGTLSKSRVFDIALKNNVNCIMHWVGTDVLKSTEAYQSGIYKEDYLDKVNHFCEVNWIQDELKQIEIDARIVNFASFDRSYALTAPDSNRLRILSYMPENRSEFYGLPKVIDLAKNFPEIDFTIVGATAKKYQPLPENLEALGWVDDMDFQFDNCHATIRVPQHDGLSNFVLESLARGKQVLYNHPYPNCIYCSGQDELENALTEMNADFKKGKYEFNQKGKLFIEKEFNSDYVFSKLINEIHSIIE